ncbi:hypothetical protein STEG23_018174 [Scotinomys teguina]
MKNVQLSVTPVQGESDALFWPQWALHRQANYLKYKKIKEQAAGVYHREARAGRYKLTYAEAKTVCEFEGGRLATYKQLEAARKIGFHVCAAGWMAKGRVGYPIVKPGPNCGFGKTGIIDYGIRLNRSEQWDAYCYNPHAKECGGVFTDPKRIFKSPGFPNEYDDNQVCYWHIRLKYGQRIHLSFLDFDLEYDPGCLADYVEIYDSYDDVHGFVGRYCGDELPEDIISTDDAQQHVVRKPLNNEDSQAASKTSGTLLQLL